MGAGARRIKTGQADTELLSRLSNRLLDAGAAPAGHGSKLARVLGTTLQSNGTAATRGPGTARGGRAGRRASGVGSRRARRRRRLRAPDAGHHPQDPQPAAGLPRFVRRVGGHRRLGARRTARARRRLGRGARCRGARTALRARAGWAVTGAGAWTGAGTPGRGRQTPLPDRAAAVVDRDAVAALLPAARRPRRDGGRNPGRRCRRGTGAGHH